MSEAPEVTQEYALANGGWYWFSGRVDGELLYDVIFVPLPENNGSIPIIPLWGEWVPQAYFVGRWWGPLTPPKGWRS